MYMRKPLSSFLFAALILLLTALPALAHDVPDMSREDCSITVDVHYDGEPVSGGTLTAVRIAEVAEEDGNYFFRRLIDGTIMTDFSTAPDAAAQDAFYRENKNSDIFDVQTVSVAKDGTAAFTDLKPGLYLLRQAKAAEGFSSMAPFLVSVPYMTDAGVYEYHVTATIKSELEREPESEPTVTTGPDKLPQTGQLNWPIPILAVTGLCLFVGGLLLRLDSKRKTNET